ncbi:HAD family phosphatase [Brevibacterium casei]|nr:HAD family phosphatase [Brevibacterium casei]
MSSEVEAGSGTAPTAAEVDRDYTAALAEVSSPMPGAPELVRALSGTVPIAVASNGRGDDVRGLLDRAGLLGFFDAIVTIDDVEQGKPAPDVYLRAAESWGSTPRRRSPSRTPPSGHRRPPPPVHGHRHQRRPADPPCRRGAALRHGSGALRRAGARRDRRSAGLTARLPAHVLTSM